MTTYIFRRLSQAALVLFLSSAVVFLIIHLIPGDPAETLAGHDAPLEVVKAIRARMGLSRPLPIQYVIWLRYVLRGDLGSSLTSGFPISTLLSQRFSATLELTTAAFLISLLVAVPLGIAAALRYRTRTDFGIAVLTSIGLATPEFWSGVLLVIAFAVALKWLPPGGRIPILQNPVTGLRSLVLPALTLAIPFSAAVIRFVRAALLDVLSEQYIRTAYAKGIPKRGVVLVHALRNSLIPVITVIGIQLGQFLGGEVLVETVFHWPGIGLLMVVALENRDYAVVQATLLVLVSTFSVVNLVTDLVYGVLDPRIRVGGSS